MNYLDFEKPLAEIEGKAEELRAMARGESGMDVSKEAEALDRKAEALLKDLYKDLTPWRKCQVARHPDRPHCKDYIDALFTEFKAHGGRGVEVVTGSHSSQEAVRYAETALEFGLAASRGSDFHSPDESHTDLGALPFLPGQLTPVWELLADRIQ